MKSLIVLIAFCAFAPLVEGSDVRLVTTATTNAVSGYVTTVDVFTRYGQTNLVRRTVTKDGVFMAGEDVFYYAGSLLAEYVDHFDHSVDITPNVRATDALIFHFDPSQQIKFATVMTTNAVFVEVFVYTNHMFYPTDVPKVSPPRLIPRRNTALEPRPTAP